MLNNWLVEGYYFKHDNLYNVECPIVNQGNIVIGKITEKQIVENNQAIYRVKFTNPINFFEVVKNNIVIEQVYFLNAA